MQKKENKKYKKKQQRYGKKISTLNIEPFSTKLVGPSGPLKK